MKKLVLVQMTIKLDNIVIFTSGALIVPQI